MATRKKKQAKSGRGRWVSFGILADLLAAVAVGIALNLPVGALFFFPFPSWQKLVGYISSVTVLSYSLGPWRVRQTLP